MSSPLTPAAQRAVDSMPEMQKPPRLVKPGKPKSLQPQYTRDTADVSADAQMLAKHQGEDVELSGEKYTMTSCTDMKGTTGLSLMSVTMKSGRSLEITACMVDPNIRNNGVTENIAGFIATVRDASGNNMYSFMLKKDAIFTEDENGELLVREYVEGMETDGDDIIIGQENKHLAGGKGNDTLVDLTGYSNYWITDKKEYGTTVHGGEGDDTVYIAGGGESVVGQVIGGKGDDTVNVLLGELINTSIDTGEGNDRIVVKGNRASIHFSQISMGAGDDSFSISGKKRAELSSSSVDTGAGNDTISVGDADAACIAGSAITAGVGDDKISVGNADSAWISGSAITTGEGDDEISVGNAELAWISGSAITTDEGDDEISVGGKGASHAGRGGDISGSSIDTGAGNDSIFAVGRKGNISGTKIVTGDGHDEISSQNLDDSDVDMGEGDDSINVRCGIGYSTIRSGSGDDDITVKYGTTSAYIDTGDGDDSVTSLGEVSLIYRSKIVTGDGDDRVALFDLRDSDIDLGGGNDIISARFFMHNCGLSAGDGDDTLSVYASILDSAVSMGSGEDVFDLAGDIIRSTLNMGKGNDSSSIGGGYSSSLIS